MADKKKMPYAPSPTIAEINAKIGGNGSMNGQAVNKVPFEGSGRTPLPAIRKPKRK